jgi:ABC-type antimicrobial peptide transport system permease subunit
MVGVAIGMFAMVLIGRVLASSVFGVRAFDLPVLGSVVVVAVVVTLIATYVAARRSLAIEPVEAMRAL